MTSKGSISGQLQRAIDAGDLMSARTLAGEVRHVSLETALRLTLLFLEQEPESYETAARRFIERLAAERAIELEALVEVAAILEQLQREPLYGSRRELFDLLADAPRR